MPAAEKTAYGAMSCIYAAAGKKFVVIVDEWDVLIRDAAANQAAQETYINFLRGMFKGTEPTRFIALAYLTGILPIKKVKTQSALNNFDEFTMLDASVRRWYDGYRLAGCHVYNPKAVVSVMLRGGFKSYWSNTGTYEAIRPLLDMDFDGLKAAVLAMLSGDSAGVRVRSFQNDVVSLRSRDDVLTLLIHLGYLAYDERTQTAFIPNEEIRSEFAEAVEENNETVLKFEGHSIILNKERAEALKKGGYIGKKVILGIRPEDVHGDEESLKKFEKTSLDAEVKVFEMLGAGALIYFNIGETDWVASVSSSIKARSGDRVRLAMDTEKIHIFDCDTEKTITD